MAASSRRIIASLAQPPSPTGPALRLFNTFEILDVTGKIASIDFEVRFVLEAGDQVRHIEFLAGRAEIRLGQFVRIDGQESLGRLQSTRRYREIGAK